MGGAPRRDRRREEEKNPLEGLFERAEHLCIAAGRLVRPTVVAVFPYGVIGQQDLGLDPLGIWVGLGAAVTYASLSLFGKKLSGQYNFWTITFYIFAIGTITIFLFQGGRPDPWPAGSGILPWMLGFVLMSTMVGFALYTKALSLLPASVAVIISTAEILSAAVLSALFLGERMGIWQILGAALIIVGVVLVTLRKKNTLQE